MSEARASKLAPNRLVAAAGTVFVSRMFGTAVRFGIQVLLARWLGAAAYGRFVVVRGWGELLAKVPNRGLDLTAVRELPIHRATGNRRARERFVTRAERSTTIVAMSLAVATAAIVAASGALDRLWLIGLVIILAQTLATLFLAMQQGLGRLTHATSVTELAQPFFFLIVVLVLFVGDRLTATTAMVALVASIGGGAILQRRNVTSFDEGEAAAPSELPLTDGSTITQPRQISELFASLLAVSAINMSGVLILGIVEGPAAAGLFAVATRVASPSRMASSGVEALVSGDLGATRVLDASEARSARQHIVDRAIRLSALPALLFLAGGIALSGLVLDVFGPDFAGARTAVIMLLLAHTVEALSGPSGYLISSCGSTRVYATIMVGHAVGFVLLATVFTLLWGITGTAISQLLVTISWNAAVVAENRRALGVTCLPTASVVGVRSR